MKTGKEAADILREVKGKMSEEENKPDKEKVEIITGKEGEPQIITSKKDRQGIKSALLSILIFSIILVAVIYFILERKPAIGPALMVFGIIPLILVKLAGRKNKDIGSRCYFWTY